MIDRDRIYLFALLKVRRSLEHAFVLSCPVRFANLIAPRILTLFHTVYINQVLGSKDGSVDLTLICTFTRMREKLRKVLSKSNRNKNVQKPFSKRNHVSDAFLIKESDISDDVITSLEEVLKDSEVSYMDITVSVYL